MRIIKSVLNLLGVSTLMAGSLAGVALAASSILYVSQTGCSPTGPGTQANPYCTIQQAVDAANPGDTIKVAAGSYTDPVTVNKTLALLGAQAGHNATHGRTNPAKESVVNTGDASGMILSADNIKVDGFMFDGNTNGPGVQTNASFSGYRLTNDIFSNNVFGLYLGSNGSNASFIEASRFDGNNQVGSANGNGIYADQGANKVFIDHNVFKNQTNSALLFTTTADTVTNDNLHINHNDFNGPSIFFLLANGHNDSFDHNNATGITGASAVYLAGSVADSTFNHNSFTGDTTGGTRNAYSAFRVTVDPSFNTANLTLVPNNNLTIDHNTARNFGDAGVSVGTSTSDSTLTNSSINHNTTNNNGTGEADFDGGILIRAGNTGLTIDHNTARNNSPFDAADYSTGTGTLGTGNNWNHNSCSTSMPANLCKQ